MDASRGRHPSGGGHQEPRRGRVIVGVHGSLSSLAALRQAVTEARRRGARLCAVWVVPEDLAWVSGVPLSEEDMRTMHEQIESAFENALGAVPDDLQLRSVVLVGAPGRELVGFARREEDLLVVGAGEHGRLRRWGARSVSAYCVRHARCPVLTVPLSAFAKRMRRARLRRGSLGPDELLNA